MISIDGRLPGRWEGTHGRDGVERVPGTDRGPAPADRRYGDAARSAPGPPADGAVREPEHAPGRADLAVRPGPDRQDRIPRAGRDLLRTERGVRPAPAEFRLPGDPGRGPGLQQRPARR